MKLRQMNEIEFETHLALIEMPQKDIELCYDEMKKSLGGWVLEALEKRLEVYKIEFDKRILIMILSFGDGVIGKCVKYLDYTAKFCTEQNISNIDYGFFMDQIYFAGIPDY